MKTYHTYSRFINKRLWFKCAIFILTVGIIVSFLPNEGKFNYQFDINKPWKYGLLQASFDFPIYKSDEQVQKEQDHIMAGYKPYYKLNKKVEEPRCWLNSKVIMTPGTSIFFPTQISANM